MSGFHRRGGIGGNPPLSAEWFAPAAATPGVAWLTSGRDAYLLAARILGPERPWLIPSFLCPVVPVALRDAGIVVHGYPTGRLEQALRTRRAEDPIIVLAWSASAGPLAADVASAADRPAVVEDRALWAGLPVHLPSLPAGRLALGSSRKWLGAAEGGWLAGIPDGGATDLAAPDRGHAALALAAAACRAARGPAEPAVLDRINAELATAAEDAVGLPRRPRAMSRIGFRLLGDSDATAQRIARGRLGARLAQALQVPAPELGLSGLVIERTDRDAFRQILAQHGIRAPIHWRDGAWDGDPDARRQAARTLTLPCPAHLDPAGEAAYIALVQDSWRCA